MTVYIDAVILLNFLVDLLLLLGTNRICGHPPGWRRILLAATVGGIYGGMCLLPPLRFLGNALWRIVSLLLISWIAFGCSISGARRCVIFALLSMALGGIALGLGNGGLWSLVASAALIALMCAVGFQGQAGKGSYMPVELSYQGKSVYITALCDTGNTLRDPVTGRPVLIVGADVARQLLGLTVEQLRSPVKSVAEAVLPGLRLIPYRSVGVSSGLLLALRLQNVKIGKWKGSSLVAFAPEGLSAEGDYQALTGGFV